eukprot:2820948-Rhodomonas_salina.1
MLASNVKEQDGRTFLEVIQENCTPNGVFAESTPEKLLCDPMGWAELRGLLSPDRASDDLLWASSEDMNRVTEESLITYAAEITGLDQQTVVECVAKLRTGVSGTSGLDSDAVLAALAGSSKEANGGTFQQLVQDNCAPGRAFAGWSVQD